MFARIFIPLKLRRATARFLNDQSGAVLALVAILIIPVLIGFAALGIDIGSAFSRQRQMQVVADASAYSGAASLVQNAVGKTLGATYYAEEAQSTAAAGGFANGGNITVTPSLNAVGDTVTVTITEQRNWALAGLFLGANNHTTAVQAVAKVNVVNNYCILALGCSAKGYGILVQGNTSVTSPIVGGCGMMSDCTKPCSVDQKGSANTIGMPVYSAGGDCVSGQSTFNVTQDAYKSGDPYLSNGFNSWLKAISWPKSPPNYTTGAAPGFYNNLTVNNGTTTLPPGVYYIEGNLKLTGGELTGSNVTLIFGPGASVTQNGNAKFTISAPSAGTTAGVALSGLGANTVSLLGNSGYGGAGAIYFPNAEVDFQGNNATGAGGQCVQIVANVVAFQGSSNVQDNCPNSGPTSVNYKIRLIR
jgi:Flp pilus assembly protein TadG